MYQMYFASLTAISSSNFSILLSKVIKVLFASSDEFVQIHLNFVFSNFET